MYSLITGVMQGLVKSVKYMEVNYLLQLGCSLEK